MLEPMEVFKKAINDKEEATRIRKAMVPSQLNTVASCITVVVNAEHPVTDPVLRGVLREATTRQLSDLEGQVESLMARVANMNGRRGTPIYAQSQDEAQGRERGRGCRGRGDRGQGRGGSNPPPPNQHSSNQPP